MARVVYKWSVRERGRDIGWKSRPEYEGERGLSESRWKVVEGAEADEGRGEPPVEDMTLEGG